MENKFTLKLCRDCKYLSNIWFISKSNQYCNNEEVISKGEDYVEGKTSARLARIYGPCFKEGRYWEKK